jgi:hypothetical protein
MKSTFKTSLVAVALMAIFTASVSWTVLNQVVANKTVEFEQVIEPAPADDDDDDDDGGSPGDSGDGSGGNGNSTSYNSGATSEQVVQTSSGDRVVVERIDDGVVTLPEEQSSGEKIKTVFDESLDFHEHYARWSVWVPIAVWAVLMLAIIYFGFIRGRER